MMITFPELLAAVFFCVFGLGLVIGAIVGYVRDQQKRYEEDEEDAI